MKIDDDEEISPFSEGIRQCVVSHDFEMSEIGKHIEREDPDDHLLNYNATIGIVRATTALKCKAFPLTLEGGALRWFVSSKPTQLPLQRLQDMRQGKNESLKNHLA
ncbi:Uncharacterized protein Adt_18277 [Abeliophyllum distichum]|uniref:Uncharacterized protein n=1 Tax=Abeliophyllum distichum TaxID=126358 RepID=A0ABD1TIY1_9LAMI